MNLRALRHPIERFRDRRDPVRGLEPINAFGDDAEDESRGDENTDLRDFLVEMNEAYVQGGKDGLFSQIEKRWARMRDDQRFEHEGTTLMIAKAALAVSTLGLIVATIALLVAANST